MRLALLVGLVVLGCTPAAPAQQPTPTAAPAAVPAAPPTRAPTAQPTRVPTVAAGDVRQRAPTPAPAAKDPSYEVDIVDDLYMPSEIKVPVGTTITFRNHGMKVHDVVSRTGDWVPPFVQPGDRTRISFPRAGRFEYTCSIHSTMGGVVVVE